MNALALGSTGPEVAALQSRLNGRPPTVLPMLAIDRVFGPKTQARVKEFQRNNGLQVDGVVGPQTAARLEQASPADRRAIHCDRAPNPASITPVKLASLGFSVPLGTPRDEALARKQDAANWVRAALNALNVVSALMRPGLTANLAKLATMEEHKALVTHFKLDKHPSPFAFLVSLGRTYTLINIVVNRADSLFIDDLANTTDFANAVPGDFQSGGKIRFCSAYQGKGPLFQTGVIVHEAAHLVDSRILHFASELPGPSGTPVDSAKNYDQLTADEASRNAYTYAQFALHTFKRQDRRIRPFAE